MVTVSQTLRATAALPPPAPALRDPTSPAFPSLPWGYPRDTQSSRPSLSNTGPHASVRAADPISRTIRRESRSVDIQQRNPPSDWMLTPRAPAGSQLIERGGELHVPGSREGR